jgi:predicted permease
MWQDIRFAVRGMRRSPGFTITVTLSLGLAMGANATIFGVVDALWLRPPGATSPGTLVRVFSTTETSSEGAWSFPEYRDLRDGSTVFAGLAARGRRGTLLRLPDGTTELELVNVVSTNFFTMLGVDAAVGRLFSSDDEPWLEREPGVVLGHAFWQRRYGGDRSIVGQAITLGREGETRVTVLGVLPASFRDLDPAADRDLWLPPATWSLLAGQSEFEQREYRWFEVFGRRNPNASVAQANAEVSQLAASLAQAFPASNRGRGARVVSHLSYRLEVGGVNAFALLGLVLLVVTITCVNVANLLLARGASRAREIAVRVSIGASRRQLLRQLMIESALVGVLGAVAGLLTAAALVAVLPAIVGAPPGFRSFVLFAVDARMLVFTLGVTLATTVAFGLVPSWIATRPDVVPVLKGETGLQGLLARHQRFGGVLVAAQVAIAVMVLCSASILARSFARSASADLGFSRNPLLLAWVTFSDIERPLADATTTRLRALPGVRDVAIAIRAPLSLSGGGRAERVFIPGTNADPAAGLPEIKYNAVTANYFETMELRVREGRTLSEADEREGPRVMVVSARFAQQFFRDGAAIGRIVRLGGPSGTDHVVVGVVDDAVVNAIGEQPESYFYVPFWRGQYGELTLIIGAPQDAAALATPVRDALRQIDSRLEPRTLVTMADLISYSQSAYRSTAFLAAAIAFVGLLLTVIGVYGVVSLNASSRTREMGVRLALGAARGQVLGLVLRNGMLPALAGAAIGLAAALMATTLLSSLLFDVSPWDVPAFAAAIAIVLGCVAVAIFIPAERVSRVPPSTALRES